MANFWPLDSRMVEYEFSGLNEKFENPPRSAWDFVPAEVLTEGLQRSSKGEGLDCCSNSLQ